MSISYTNSRALRRIASVPLALGLVLASIPASSAASIDPDTLSPTVVSTACPGGVVATALVPAKGFNPLTATAAELLANNLPQRPTGSAKELATWTTFVTTVKPQAACATDKPDTRTELQGPHSTLGPVTANNPASVGAYGEENSANWSGSIATGTYWNDAYGIWTIQVPQAPDTSCAYSSQWTGIGQAGSQTYPLVQAGSEDDACDNRSSSNIYLWWEVVWTNGGVSQQAVTGASAGDIIWTHIHVPNDCGFPTMTIVDLTTGFDKTYAGPWTACSDGTAEWILERTEENSVFPQLANASVDFIEAEAAGPGVSPTGVGNLPHYLAIMTDCPSATPAELAYPGAISSSGVEFTDHWNSYGIATAVSSC